MTDAAPPSPADLLAEIAETIGTDPAAVTADSDLFELGLDSIGLMRLVNRWRRAGVDVSFADLAERPSLRAWSALLGAGRPEQAPPPDLPPAPAADADFPLAVMQHAYWAGRDDEAPLGGVSAHLYCEFDRPAPGLDPQRLREAFELLLARHDSLRLQVGADGRQRVLAQPSWTGLQVHDLRTTEDPVAHLSALRERLSHQRLTIDTGEVLSAALTLLPDGSSRLHLDVDMIAGDAVSYRILTTELAGFYADGRDDRPPLGYSFREYGRDRPVARAAAAERAAEYWAARLPGLPEAPPLPRTPVAPAGPPRVARRWVHLDPAEREALTAGAAARGLTPATVFATAFAEVLGHWSAQPRFLLNVPLFDRAPVHPDVDRLVGDFSSSVLLAVDLDPSADLASNARTLQRQLHADAGHADRPGVQVLRDLTRRRGRPVLAPVVFTSALNLGELFAAGVREQLGEPVWIISQGPQVLLDAQVTELGGGTLLNWDSREDEFPDGVLDAMFAAFTGLLHDLARDPDAWATRAADRLPAVGPPTHRVVPTPAAAAAGDRSAAVQQVVGLVWQEVLGLAELDPDTDYFALGGDSVLAAAVVRALQDALDTDEVRIGALLAAPTVRGMAERIVAGAPDRDRLEAAAEIYLEVAALSDDEVAEALGGGTAR